MHPTIIAYGLEPVSTTNVFTQNSVSPQYNLLLNRINSSRHNKRIQNESN